MRARYSAHVTVDMDFVTATHNPKTRKTIDQKSARDWAEKSDWLGLEIVRTEAGQEEDDRGMVEFIARYKDKKGNEYKHHELSSFIKVDGEWYFENAKAPAHTTVKRDTPKVGRNDPCSCGSGRKYKKCCA